MCRDQYKPKYDRISVHNFEEKLFESFSAAKTGLCVAVGKKIENQPEFCVHTEVAHLKSSPVQ